MLKIKEMTLNPTDYMDFECLIRDCPKFMLIKFKAMYLKLCWQHEEETDTRPMRLLAVSSFLDEVISMECRLQKIEFLMKLKQVQSSRMVESIERLLICIY